MVGDHFYLGKTKINVDTVSAPAYSLFIATMRRNKKKDEPMSKLSNDQVLARYMRATTPAQIALYARELEARGL